MTIIVTTKQAGRAGAVGAELMRQIFLDCASRAERIAAERERDGSFYAGIIAGATPLWHVVTTLPNYENVAAAFLVGRRFAIYQPELAPGTKFGTYRARRVEPMFPGVVLVFVWDIGAHASRILACPGVTGILRHVDGGAATLDDCTIHKIMAQDYGQLRPRTRRKPRRKSVDEFNADIPEGAVRLTTKPYLDGLAELDSQTRLSALHAALGLSS